MRVFVLTTGRAGSVTFARACGHATNFTAGHETHAGRHGDRRFDYPDWHIEVDNRLAWFLGSLAERFPDARYVHLVRDPEATAASFVARWPAEPRGEQPGASLMGAFANGIIMRRKRWPRDRRTDVARFMVGAINANIRAFLADRPHITVRLEDATDDFPRFWSWSGAEGDLGSAMNEWRVRHNARRREPPVE